MSVAAYASLVSLMQVIDQIKKHHGRGWIHLDKRQIHNFQDHVRFLQDFLELHSQGNNKDIRGLTQRITNAAVEAEMIIDYHVVDQLRGVFEKVRDKGLKAFRVALKEVVEEMECIKDELKMINLDSPTVHHHRPVDPVPTTVSEVKSGPNRNMVGSEEHMKRIIDKLTNHESGLQVITIVGMGGIGKTTLARCVFEDSGIVNRFDRRIWCTISQQYNVQQILQDILKGLLKEEFNQGSRELGGMLHKSLYGLRYLIVMDDMWSVEAWDSLKVFFPQNGNGSRVLVTTRLSSVCVSVGSNEPYKMNLLDDDQSWDLLHQKVFDQRDCSAELKEIGKRIAKSCRGLPISIVTTAGLLSKSDMTPVYWESVSRNVIQIVSTGDDEHCLKILRLSYNNLPMHLKPCFLHFRIYPGDSKISIRQLLDSWIAEGIIKPILGRRLEDVAREYLKDLVDRNLILIRERNFYGKIKFCGIHDLLRELMLRESKEEDFVQIPRIQDFDYGWDKGNRCSLCFENFSHRSKDPDVKVVFLNHHHPGSPLSSSKRRISVCHECGIKYPYIHRLRFLKFPDVDSHVGAALPTTLRFIRNSDYVKIGKSLDPILRLWNLQIFRVLGNEGVELSWIWEMPQLLYLAAFSFNLGCPKEGATLTVLEQMQTLHAKNLRFTKELVERIPNLKRLKISNDISCCLENTALLHQLESLTLWRMNCKTYPTSLNKLSLKHCHLSCEDVSVIGSLSNLQVLKLLGCEFEGHEWIPMEGEFLQLKVLDIYESHLRHWKVEQDHYYFPRLERLRLCRMDDLKEIPCGIAEISTLISIDLDYCDELLVKSARLILEQQRDLGNESLEIHIDEWR